MKKNKKAQDSGRKAEIVQIYVDLVESGVLFPTRGDLTSKGISRDMIRGHFVNISGLRELAKAASPESFAGSINLETYLSDSNVKKTNKRVLSSKKYLITTAVSGQKVHKGFLEAINNYCKINDAKLIILPSHDPAHNLDNENEWTFDPLIIHTKYDYVFDDLKLNSNLMISGIRVTAKQINPVTGLSEISQKEGTCIFASPKQSLEYDAVSANRLPHARMSTGCLTIPNYNSTKGNSQRMAYLANAQHIIGGIVVNVEDDKIFHFTQIQADEKGNFCHLGYEYSAKLKKKVNTNLVMGDLHAGEHDESALGSWLRYIDKLEIKKVVLHDVFDGRSVNPHSFEDIMQKSQDNADGVLSLENELKITSTVLDRILCKKSVIKCIITDSNHDDFVDRFIKRGLFIKDPVNFRIGCKIAAEVMGSSKNYLEEALKLVKPPKFMNKMVFLTTESDYMIGDVNVAHHGHIAGNGAKGGIRALSKALYKAIVGHSHSAGKFKHITQVGTTSKLRQGYNRGPSSWIHCSALVYDNGQVQLINSIGGRSFL